MNIQQVLDISTKKLKSKNIPSANLDAEVLLLEALKRYKNDSKNLDKSWLYIHNDYKLNKNEEKLFNNFIDQREKHKPVAYITNRKEFYGYDFYINENVLIPRPETEFIVDEVLKTLKTQNSAGAQNFVPLLLDIGTGSGCIIISILNELEKNKKNKFINKAFANDISEKAIEVAKINAKKYNLDQKIKFISSDLEKAIDKKIFSDSIQIIITANLPYIKDSAYKTLQPNVKNYEPAIALKAGEDGLDYIKKLINLISKIQLKLNKNICLFLEADPEQISEIAAILKEKFTDPNIEIIKDLRNKKRVVSVKLHGV